ncbi:putative membrane protein [Litoreibacter ponti]|uniref:Putative membrane protein n=1 Tax=Litoreibacter ponti TaxID=1510457 RepID=A0A2T6BJA1_9RHOB|nr:DUF202 domain-containing protein [Litoreibacter ponti]PTX56134.1 putative membrane protein [Litoreibacter ponti]
MPSSNLSKDPDREELADARTAWAQDRTLLANERTFAAWMRTGMACVALALGLRAVFGDTEYPYVAKGVAEVFIIAAVLIFISAAKRCGAARGQIDRHDTEVASYTRMITLAAILAVGSICVGGILWLL